MDREDRINNYCTICDLTKLDIDRAADTPGGFRRHIKQEHHMWNYLKFMIFLQNQDQDDDDGLELYVRQCIERKDVSWFPMGQAMCMLQDEDSTDKKENTVDTTDSGRRGGVSSTDNESLSEMKLLIEEMKKGMEDKMEKIEKQIAGINSAGNLGGNILSTSPSFRVGSQRGNQLRHTTGGNVNSPMLEAQRIAARQQAQQQAEELPPLS